MVDLLVLPGDGVLTHLLVVTVVEASVSSIADGEPVMAGLGSSRTDFSARDITSSMSSNLCFCPLHFRFCLGVISEH